MPVSHTSEDLRMASPTPSLKCKILGLPLVIDEGTQQLQQVSSVPNRQILLIRIQLRPSAISLLARSITNWTINLSQLENYVLVAAIGSSTSCPKTRAMPITQLQESSRGQDDVHSFRKWNSNDREHLFRLNIHTQRHGSIRITVSQWGMS